MPSPFSHSDFGPQVAVSRILELLRKYEVPASLYVPSWIGERFPEQIATIAEDGHESLYHGYLHEPPYADAQAGGGGARPRHQDLPGHHRRATARLPLAKLGAERALTGTARGAGLHLRLVA